MFSYKSFNWKYYAIKDNRKSYFSKVYIGNSMIYEDFMRLCTRIIEIQLCVLNSYYVVVLKGHFIISSEMKMVSDLKIFVSFTKEKSA